MRIGAKIPCSADLTTFGTPDFGGPGRSPAGGLQNGFADQARATAKRATDGIRAVAQAELMSGPGDIPIPGDPQNAESLREKVMALRALQAQEEELKRARDTWQGEVDANNARIRALHRADREMENQIEDMRTEIDDIREILDEDFADLEEVLDNLLEADDLTDDERRALEAIQGELTSLKTDLEDEVATLEEQIDQLDNANRRDENEIEALEEENILLEGRIEGKNGEIEALQPEKAAAEAALAPGGAKNWGPDGLPGTADDPDVNTVDIDGDGVTKANGDEFPYDERYIVDHDGIDEHGNPTTGNGVPDYNRHDPVDRRVIIDPDLDGDGTPNDVEMEEGMDPYDPNQRRDIDGDRLSDHLEEAGWDVTIQRYAVDDSGNKVDRNGDGKINGDDLISETRHVNSATRTTDSVPDPTDTDGDTLSDKYEYDNHLDPASQDTDGDGLSDADEVRAGTNPLNQDSDGDGEVDGTDPEPLVAAAAALPPEDETTDPAPGAGSGELEWHVIENPTMDQMAGVGGLVVGARWANEPAEGEEGGPQVHRVVAGRDEAISMDREEDGSLRHLIVEFEGNAVVRYDSTQRAWIIEITNNGTTTTVTIRPPEGESSFSGREFRQSITLHGTGSNDSAVFADRDSSRLGYTLFYLEEVER